MKLIDKNKILTKSTLTLFLRLTGLFISFLFMKYVISNFGKDIWGQYFYFEKTLLLLTMLSTFGLSTVGVKFISKYYSSQKYLEIKKIYYQIIFIVSIISLLIILISLFVYLNFDNQSNMLFFIIISLLPSSILFINSDYFRSIDRTILFSLTNKNSYVIASTYIFLLIYVLSDYNVVSLFSFYFISLLLFFFISTVYIIFKLSKFKFSGNILSISVLKKLLSTSFPILLSSFMLLLMQWVDVFILKMNVGFNELGTYGTIVKFSSINTIILYSVNSIAAPNISKYFHSNDITSLRKTIYQVSKIIFIFSIPLILIQFIFPEFIYFFDPTILDNSNSIVAFRILLLAQLINSVSGPVGQILLMTNKEKKFRNIIFISLVVNVFLNIILIPLFGTVGAAYSTIISISIWNLSSVLLVKKYFNILTIYWPGKRFE